MKTVFADTSFYIALVNERDANHSKACQFADEYLGDFVTSAWVIEELANYLCNRANRSLFLSLYDAIRSDPNVVIVPLSNELLEQGIHLYAMRSDKDWSLTDCISFLIMQRQNLREAVATDHHFVQAGFAALLGKYE